MDTVVISSSEDLPLENLPPILARHWSLLKTSPDRVVIEESNSRVYIYHPKIESGSGGIDPKRLFLDYSCQDFVKNVIEVIGDDPQLLIDNDFGTCLPGNKFVARLRTNDRWDWRADITKDK